MTLPELETGLPDPRAPFLAPPGPPVSTEQTDGDDYLDLRVLRDLPDVGDGTGDDWLLLDGFDAPIPPLARGLMGDDTMIADFADGWIDAGPGADVLLGTVIDFEDSVSMVLLGGPGDDTLYSGEAGTPYGGPGDDVFHLLPLAFSEFESGPIVEGVFHGGDGYDVALQYGDEERFAFLREFSFLFGIEEVRAVEGAGDIWIRTSEGMDNVLLGNSGNNVLLSRGGVDVMTGGAGRDVFGVAALEGLAPAAQDLTITDFDGDVLVFDAALLGIERGDPWSVQALDPVLGRRLLDEGRASYDREGGVIALDADLDGTADATVRLGGEAEIGYDDLFYVLV